MLNLNFDQKSLEKICRDYDVEFLGVFGSVARGEDRPDSDVDLLVRFAKTSRASLLDLVGMEFSLQDMIGKKVDLVTEGFLSPYIRDKVMSQVQPVYGSI